MNIGIIGYGFVGSALHNGLCKDVKTLLIDPKLGTTVSDLVEFSPKIIFVCVPTPMKENGSQDLSIFKDVIKEIISLKIDSVIVIKSTILPDALYEIYLEHSNIVYNPEFLREKHANKDFIESDLIVFGGSIDYVKQISDFYDNYTQCKCKEYIKTDIITASLIKYSINSFLAMKVTFFNELKNVFDASNAEDTWENFISYLTKDLRLGHSHMSVPGHDGKLGFGGACLPKDSKAFVEFAKSNEVRLTLLNQAIILNNHIRSRYDVDERESEQNIRFLDPQK